MEADFKEIAPGIFVIQDAAPPLSRREITHLRNLDIVTRYEGGENVAVIAEHFGLSKAAIYKIAGEHDAHRIYYRDWEIHEARKTRNAKMCEAYLSGRSLDDVGQEYGITRERVRQILVKNGHDDRHNGFLTEVRVSKRARDQEKAFERKARKEYWAHERQRCRELYNAGLKYHEIAGELQHSMGWVQNEVWRTGGPDRNLTMIGQARKERLTEEQKREMVERYSRGEHVRTIGNDHGVHLSTVYQLAVKAGVQRHRLKR